MRRLAMCTGPSGALSWRSFRETATEAAALPDGEEEEVRKDQEALRRFTMGVGFCLVAVGASFVVAPRVRKRYFGEQGSYLVRVETHGKPSLGGPFSLVTMDGVPVTQAEFLGKWTFFYFGFTHCPEICPVELNRMSHVVTEVHRAKPTTPFVPLFISCDPKRDSLHAIREYLTPFHSDFVGLVGTPAQVQEACRSYRVYYSLPSSDGDDYLIDHSIAIFLFDPNGNFVDFFGSRYNEHEITEKVLKYITNFERDPTWTNY